MKIRPRNFPEFQQGGVAPQWYIDAYGNRVALQGWNRNLRYDQANQNLNANDHRNAGDLNTAYRKNDAYTRDQQAVGSDIQNYYNNYGNGMTPEQFVNFYNTNAGKIRSHWDTDQTYGTRSNKTKEHNQLFRQMFASRSNQGNNNGGYNIGYQDNLENVEGSSTWLRRMDRYQNKFDPNNPDQSRLHKIKIGGKEVTVYKEDNGDIGIYNPVQKPSQEQPIDGGNPLNGREIVVKPSQQETPQQETSQKKNDQVEPKHKKNYGFDWNKIKESAQQIFGNPNLYAGARLANTLIGNERIYNEQIKGIRPVLKQTYNTYRQVVGDEATKQAYYRRAVQGQTRAARPFTADADKQMAYQFEAKRVGDELRAQGDLADNQEIRRTSDESNQHQWSNTQRATEVANANLESINKARALRHNILAQKHAAQYSSIDNFLKEIETRKRGSLAEDQQLQDKIFLAKQAGIESDINYQEAYQNYLKVKEKHKNSDGTYDFTNSEVRAAKGKVDTAISNFTVKQLEALRDYRRGLISGKFGTKITYKTKDDLLYKSTRDVVEHFRKMSKMSSDAQNRKTPKIEKLTSHPKGNTRKYQQGGLAPFLVYTPAVLGGERSVQTNQSSETSSSNKKGSDKNETLDMVKELFKALAGKGLPSDVNSLYVSMKNFLGEASAFGNTLSTSDIASMYLSQLEQVNRIQYLKSKYDDAEKTVIQNDAINELAVDFAGRLVGRTKNGEITYMKSLEEAVEKGINPLTNGQLLRLRAIDPSLAGHEELDQIAANGIGMSKIGEYIKSMLPSIESSETKNEEFIKVKQGIRVLQQALQEAPEGDYKRTITNKSNLDQAKYALNYLKGILPRNMRNILDINAQRYGMDSDSMLANLIASKSGITREETYTPYTGKAAKDSNGGSDEKGDSNNSAGLAFVLGQGPRETLTFNTGTSMQVSALGIRGALQTHSNENLGQGATLQDATKTQQGGYFEWNKATFGGSRLNPNAFNHIILNDSTVMGVDLPYTTNINGNEIPDFQQLRRMEEADQEIRQKNVKSDDYNSINQIYQVHQLPPKFDQNGNLNTQRYKRFAVIQATLDEAALTNKDSILADEVALANDVERDLYEQAMKGEAKTKNYSLNDGFMGLWKDNLYKGSIFIPYKEDIAFAAISSGKALKVDIPNNSSIVQQMQYAPATLVYKSPETTLSQIKND